MRLFRRIREPVEGTAQVVSATTPDSHSASWSNVRMRLIVAAEGHAPFELEHSCMCRADRRPYPGMTLPVTFDARDRDRLDVDWSRVPTARERAVRQADAIVQAMTGGGAVPPDRL